MKRELTIDNILILWLLAAAMVVIMLVSMHTHKVSAPTMQWQADSSWVKPWNFKKNE